MFSSLFHLTFIINIYKTLNKLKKSQISFLIHPLECKLVKLNSSTTLNKVVWQNNDNQKSVFEHQCYVDAQKVKLIWASNVFGCSNIIYHQMSIWWSILHMIYAQNIWASNYCLHLILLNLTQKNLNSENKIPADPPNRQRIQKI